MAERTHSVRLRLELDQLRRDSSEASRAVGGIGSAAQEAGKQSRALDALGSAARGVGQTVAAVGTVAAGAMAALGVATLATGVSYNSLEQSTRAALTTLLGGAEAATAQMDRLREFVRTALFPREVFIEGQQQLLAFGFAAERVIPTLDAVQQAVAATGGSAQVFSEVVAILAEMQSTGEITAGTLNELGRRGINAAQLIGMAMGKTENEIRESITSGALDGRQAIEILVTAMETRFAGAAALISNTWVGARGLVTAALRDIGSASVEAFIDPSGGGAAIIWAQNLAEVLYALERQVRDLVAELRQSADPAFERWGELLLDLSGAIDRFDVDLDGLVDRARDGAPAFAAFGAGIAAAGGAAVLSAVPGFGALTGVISPLGAAIVAAAAASPQLRDVLGELLAALAPLAPLVVGTGTALAGVASGGLAAVADAAESLLPLVELAVDLFTMLPQPIQQATVALVAWELAFRKFGTRGGQIGTVVTALAALGAATEFVRGETVAAGVSSADLAEDLERLAAQGRVTGELMRLFGDDAFRFKSQLGAAASQADLSRESLRRLAEDGMRPIDVDGRASAEAIGIVDQALAEMVAAGGDGELALEALADRYDLTAGQVETLLELMPEYNRAVQRQAEEATDAAEAEGEFATATERATAAIAEQADELRAQTDPIFALHQALEDAQTAQDDYNEAVAEFGADSDEASAAALGLLEAAGNLATAAGDAGGAFDGTLTPAMEDALRALGANDDQIAAVREALAILRGELDQVEDTYTARIEQRGAAEAAAAAQRLVDRLREIDRLAGFISFAPAGSSFRNVPFQHGGPVQHGGPIDFGQHGIDRVPALLTRGEHVWTVREVDAAGGHQAVEALRAAVLGSASAFAVGGPVGVPRMQSGGPAGGGAPERWHVDNLNVQAWSGRFSLRQIEQQLAMEAAA